MIDIFSIAIFVDDKVFYFNKNLPKLSYQQFEKLISHLPKNIVKNIDDIFPLTFETDFDWEEQGYHNFSGMFDAFEKVRDKINKAWLDNIFR